MKKKELRALYNLITTKWVQSENARTQLHKELEQANEEYDKIRVEQINATPSIFGNHSKSAYAELYEVTTNLRQEIKDLKDRMTLLVTERDDLKEKLANATPSPWDGSLQTPWDEYLKLEINGLKDRAFKLIKERDDLQQELKASDRQNSILRAQLDQTQSQSQKEGHLQAQIMQLNAELSHANVTIADVEASKRALSEDYKGQIDHLKKLRVMDMDSISVLKQEKQKYLSTIEALRAELNKRCFTDYLS